MVNCEQSKKLTNKELFIKRDEMEETEEDEFYYADLEGLKAIDQKNKQLGNVVAVHEFGAGVFLEIFLNQKKDSEFFAFNKESIINVDLKNSILKLNYQGE